jgi:hypothetical protein
VAISKDRHARIIIMRPENILHSEAGYIFADCSRRNRFFLQFSGGPYITLVKLSGVANRERENSHHATHCTGKTSGSATELSLETNCIAPFFQKRYASSSDTVQLGGDRLIQPNQERRGIGRNQARL